MTGTKISRGLRFPLAALLALTLGLVWTSFAAADAGNPILGTIHASSSETATTVTIYVRGQWNWLSHNSDCNNDRAATGVGIIWNDRNGASAGTNEVQRITLSGTTAGATFTVKWKNPAGTTLTSATINSSDSAAALQTKLEALTGAGNVSVTGGPGQTTPWLIEFKGALAGTNVNALATGVKSAGLNIAYATTTNSAAGEPFNGWLVSNGGISAYVGYKTQTTAGGPVDRMVHPADRGNQVEGYTVAGIDYPASQRFVDPASNNPADYSSWKGGCGRTPISATASKDTNPEATDRACAGLPPSGNTLCANHPWGSWGYEKTGDFVGYSHTYLKTLLPDKVCVNFYDVHGGGLPGTSSFQLVKSASEITVDGNGDNSIDTNDFNVFDTSTAASNCITLSNPTLTTIATGGTVGDNIHDTATLGNVPAGTGGTITFRAFKTADCTGTAVFESIINIKTPPLIGGPGNYNSADFNTGAATAGAGTYYWTAEYSGDSANLVLGASAACGDQTPPNDETSDVGKKQPALSTDAGGARVLRANGTILFDMATLTDGFPATGAFTNPGVITFELYKGANCTPVAGGTVLVTTVGIFANGTVTGNGSYKSEEVHVTTAGQYRWIANYSGDDNNFATHNTCNGTDENVLVEAPGISITKGPDGTVVRDPHTVTFTITVTNTGDTTLTNVTVTDALTPSCNRTSASADTPGLASMAAGSHVTYTCTTDALHASFTNSATATGTPPTGPNVTATDTAPVTVIHPQIDVTKTPHSQSVPVGGTVTWTIEVKNTGDVALDHVTVTDAQAPDCARPDGAAHPDDLGTLAANDNAAGGLDEKSYECTRSNILADFLNIVQACGSPNPDETGGQPVCDDDQTGGGPPGCPDADHCGSVSVSRLQTKQDFKPTDSARLGGLVGTPAGTLTFELYKDALGVCGAANLIYTDTVSVTGNNPYTTSSTLFLSELNKANAAINSSATAGNYNWKVSYSGDAASHNAAITGTCGTENFQIDNG